MIQTITAGPLSVSQLGLGCMGMSQFYGAADEAASRDIGTKADAYLQAAE